jgi:uncharacterized glyoxalase superfamily protein PhnB
VLGVTPRWSAIALVVGDMAAATGFYQRFGLSFTEPSPGHAEAQLTDGCTLILDTEDTVRSYLPDWQRPTGDPKVALAFQFDSPDEVDAKYAELTEVGYYSAHAPWNAFWGQRYATVRDPDGNGVDLYAVLPSD